MKSTYQEWIDANVEGDGAGKCQAVTAAMALAFPELTRVRGHYLDLLWGDREHWWCVTSDGEVVDPTVAQFPTKGQGAYTPLEEGTPEPTGRCMGCGAYVYEEAHFCSARCERLTAESMGMVIGDEDGRRVWRSKKGAKLFP